MDIERGSILVVDDEPANVALMQRALERVGIARVYGTTDPARVEEYLGRVNPDLLVLDLHMPGRDGFEVLKALPALGPEASSLPVLVLTADVTPEAKHRALSLGAKDFLTKPFDLLEATLRVRRMLETRFLQLRLKNENLRLEAAVLERTRELEEAHLDALQRLARAAEYRDDETGEHVRRVAENAARIALRLGLGADQVEAIRMASTLHDIGKIAVPDAILRKPGRLTPEERELMKTHTTVGAAMLEGGKSEYLRSAMRIARHHHERWDGAGYPDGLWGEAIPLDARVVAVADVFDALTSIRPYKPAWEVEDAAAEIEGGAGAQFDPAVVQAFLEEVRVGGLAVSDGCGEGRPLE